MVDYSAKLIELDEQEIEQVDGSLANVGLGMVVGAVGGGVSSYLSGGSAGQIAGAALWGAVGGLWDATGGVIQTVNAAALGVMGGVAFGGGPRSTM